MSGPKAFRIVTRAEIMSICRRNLARPDAAIEGWISSCQRNGTIEKADIDKVITRRDKLRGLLTSDRFVELQKQVPAEISYLQADAERRAEKAAEVEAQSKRAMRRMKGTAQALFVKLESSGILIPSEIRDHLTSAAASPDRLEAAINKAFLLLQSPAHTKRRLGPAARRCCPAWSRRKAHKSGGMGFSAIRRGRRQGAASGQRASRGAESSRHRPRPILCPHRSARSGVSC